MTVKYSSVISTRFSEEPVISIGYSEDKSRAYLEALRIFVTLKQISFKTIRKIKNDLDESLLSELDQGLYHQ